MAHKKVSIEDLIVQHCFAHKLFSPQNFWTPNIYAWFSKIIVCKIWLKLYIAHVHVQFKLYSDHFGKNMYFIIFWLAIVCKHKPIRSLENWGHPDIQTKEAVHRVALQLKKKKGVVLQAQYVWGNPCVITELCVESVSPVHVGLHGLGPLNYVAKRVATTRVADKIR